ncbi:MAG TPA: hypothetical protein VF701_14035 [Thermoanaerobaculia bacterium]
MSRAVELINLAVDGEASESELRELDTILAHSPEAVATLEAYEQLTSQLGNARDLAPPSFLKSNILREIASRREPRGEGFWATVRTFATTRRPVLAFGSLVAAGLIIVLATPLLHDSSTPPAPDSTYSGAMRKLDTAEQLYRSADGSLSATVRQTPTAVTIEPATTDPVELTLHWENAPALDSVAAGGWLSVGPHALRGSCAGGVCPSVTFSREKLQGAILTLTRPDGVILQFSISSE